MQETMRKDFLMKISKMYGMFLVQIVGYLLF